MRHRKRRIVRHLLASTLVAVPATAFAQQVDVPLAIAVRHLQAPVASALGMDGGGRVTLTRDACNRVALSDLELGTAGERLEVSMAVSADGGRALFGQCVGPLRWRGRLSVELVPTVHEGGLMLELNPATAQLLRTDGSQGLLGRVVQPLTETLVLPRLGEARLDLREPLIRIDELLREVLDDVGAASANLVEQSRLTAVTVAPEDNGVQATLSFEVEPPPAASAASAPERALEPSELAQWQRLEDELDGFLTTVIARLASQTQDEDLRLDLLAVLLDARHTIAEALAEEGTAGATDPVRDLFVRSWDQLRPHLIELERTRVPADADGLRLAGFVAGGDAVRALDALGAEFGLEITRDGLRRLARMLLSEDAPDSFTPLPLEVSPQLRGTLMGEASRALLVPLPDAAQRRRARQREPGRSGDGTLERAFSAGLDAGRGLLDWIVPRAHAQQRLPPGAALRGLVPQLATLDEYLNLVSELLAEESQARLADTRVPDAYRSALPPLIAATAWKESCWRQWDGSVDQPRVMTSAVGALGMMQIHARVWRGMYDLERLGDDVQYNLGAGIEILEHYLVDYAIRRGEHEHGPGGAESLVRATYAAYNGGPSHLSRYRKPDTPARLRAIDQEFWRHYETMRDNGWPNVSSCYSVP